MFAAPIFNQTATEEIKDGRKISKKTEKMANKDIATNIFDPTAMQDSIGCWKLNKVEEIALVYIVAFIFNQKVNKDLLDS